RDGVARALLVERALVLRRETQPAVLLREAHAGEAAVVQHALELPGVSDLGELLLLALSRPEQPLLAVVAGEVLGQPRSRPGPEGFDALGVGVAHVGSLMVVDGQAACSRRAARR